MIETRSIYLGMLSCCCVGEAGQKAVEIPDIQQRSVLDTAEAKLVEKAIDAEIQRQAEDRTATDKKKELEAPPFGSFSVLVPAKGHSNLGLALDTCNRPMIREVGMTGAVQVFNELYPGLALRPFDIITSINGVEGDDALEKLMRGKMEGNVDMTILRPRKLELFLCKTDNLGLKLDFGSSALGAVVREVGKGLVSAWNAQHSDATVAINDRVLEVNRSAHRGEELLTAIQGIQKGAKFSLTVLKY